MKTTAKHDEKREFFRINQEVIFDFTPIDAQSANNCQPEETLDNDSTMALMSQLKKQDREAFPFLKAINEKDRILGSFLQKMSKKINLIAQHQLFSSANQRKQTLRINLSEGGLAFLCEERFEKGDFLLLQLIFLPSYLPMVLFARVVRCDFVDSQYHIAARFYRLNEHDQQTLSRQIFKAQTAHRKQQNTMLNAQEGNQDEP